MTKWILLSFFFIVTLQSFGQLTSIGKPRRPTSKELRDDKINKNCFYKKKFTASQRRSFYPFNKAVEVELISFDNSDETGNPKEIKLFREVLSLKNGKVGFDSLKEKIGITKSQIDTLTDILYNWSYGGPFYSFSEPCCYKPRNGILFIDKTSNAFAYIELCFECEGFRKSAKQVLAGHFCNQKYELLREFFAKRGIKFGTEKHLLGDEE
jgi:hypothetical protein